MRPRKRWLKWSLSAGGVAVAILLLIVGWFYWWWFRAPHERIADVTYGRRGDARLQLDVFRPREQNGAGVVVLVSGSWKSGAGSVQPYLFAPFLRRGYTVFAVRRLSKPDCLIGEIAEDVHRAVRFIDLGHPPLTGLMCTSARRHRCPRW